MARGMHAKTNRGALDAVLRGVELRGVGPALAMSARTLASAMDVDVSPCEECRRVGSPMLPSLAGEYRRALVTLAEAMGDEEGMGDRKATVLRLAGGVQS